MVLVKKICSECRAKFEVNLDEIEEGDAVNCSECNLEYVVVADRKGKLKLIESKEFEMEDSEDEGEEEEDYEEDSD